MRGVVMSGTVNLKQLTAAALHQALAPMGVTPSMARRIQAAALAPADPSSQDRAVAAQAAQMAAQAQAEISQARQSEDSGTGGAAPASSRESRAVAAYGNLEPQPDPVLSLFA